MNKLATYLLLAVFCVNIFGAALGAFVHYAAHVLQGSNTHWHTHHHTVAADDAYTHEHQVGIQVLLDAFGAERAAHCFKHLNLLMIVLNALLSKVNLQLPTRVIVTLKPTWERAVYKTLRQDVPTPPPRHLF